MKNNIITLILASVFAMHTYNINAQVYRGSATEALKNTGGIWVQEKLPPSLLTFSDYSGQVKIKTMLSSLFRQSDSLAGAQMPANAIADFTMTLDKEQINQQQVSTGKNFTTTGLLVMNGTSKKTTAQCELVPRINPEDGFNISVTIRFNPADFGMTMVGETANDPLIVKIVNGYLNKSDNNLAWK